jgi:hypothetical protein
MFQLQLAHRFQEGKGFNIAHGAADLDDVHVGLRREREGVDAALDLVGHVRDHLHRAPQVISPTLTRKDRVVDLAGGDVVAARDGLVDESLVVPEIQIRLGAVIGDEHLAMLERAHRARVDVQVGIELLRGDPEAAGLQEQPKARRGDPFAKRRDHASGHNDDLGHWLSP